MRLLASLGLCAAALAGCASYNPVNYLNPAGVPQVPPMTPRPFAVQEIGSFHVGGRQAVLSGLQRAGVAWRTEATPA